MLGKDVQLPERIPIFAKCFSHTEIVAVLEHQSPTRITPQLGRPSISQAMTEPAPVTHCTTLNVSDPTAEMTRVILRLEPENKLISISLHRNASVDPDIQPPVLIRPESAITCLVVRHTLVTVLSLHQAPPRQRDKQQRVSYHKPNKPKRLHQTSLDS